MPKAACDDSSIMPGLRFTTYEYDPVLEKHFAHARMYDPAQGRMLGTDPVRRGLNGYAYCGNDPANQTDPTGEIANAVFGGIAGGIIGGAFGFAGSALSHIPLALRVNRIALASCKKPPWIDNVRYSWTVMKMLKL